MSNLDVALKLRWLYEKSSAAAAKKDIASIGDAAKGLAKSRGVDQIGKDIEAAGLRAKRLERQLSGLRRARGFTGLGPELEGAAGHSVRLARNTALVARNLEKATGRATALRAELAGVASAAERARRASAQVGKAGGRGGVVDGGRVAAVVAARGVSGGGGIGGAGALAARFGAGALGVGGGAYAVGAAGKKAVKTYADVETAAKDLAITAEQSDATVNDTMTALSISYRNSAIGLIADEVLPRTQVGSERFSWMEHPIGQAFAFPDTEVGRRGRVNRVEFSGIKRTDEIHDYALEDAIPETDIEEAEAMRSRGLGTFDPVLTSTETLTDLILTDREVRVAAMVQNPANYGPNRRLVLSGTAKFSDYDNSSPIEVLKAGFNGTLIYRPNTMVLSREGWSTLASHPHIVNACKGNVTGRGIVSTEDVVKLFFGEGLSKILVGEAFVNTARPGQPETVSRVWGKSIQLLHINPAARPENGATYGMTAQYGTRRAGSWKDMNVGSEGGRVVRVVERVREVITAPDSGYLIQNVF